MDLAAKVEKVIDLVTHLVTEHPVETIVVICLVAGGVWFLCSFRVTVLKAEATVLKEKNDVTNERVILAQEQLKASEEARERLENELQEVSAFVSTEGVDVRAAVALKGANAALEELKTANNAVQNTLVGFGVGPFGEGPFGG